MLMKKNLYGHPAAGRALKAITVIEENAEFYLGCGQQGIATLNASTESRNAVESWPDQPRRNGLTSCRSCPT